MRVLKAAGMHKAALDLQKAMQKMKKSYREYYVLKMDVKKYFNSIDKKILYKILYKRIKDKKLLWLISQILSAQPRQKGKKKFKKKIRNLLNEIKQGKLSSKEARLYLTGHLGYFEIANTYDLKKRNIELNEELVKNKLIY